MITAYTAHCCMCCMYYICHTCYIHACYIVYQTMILFAMSLPIATLAPFTLTIILPASSEMTVKVVKLTGQGAVKRRIMDMGITKGVEIFIRKVAPLGDPVEVTVRGYELSLRKDDASMIEVE